MFKKHKTGASVMWRGTAVNGSNRGHPTFCHVTDVLDGCCTVQEGKHQAITPVDIKEIPLAINKKHLMEAGTWAFGTSVSPSQCRVKRQCGFAAEQMIAVKLSKGEVQAKTNTCCIHGGELFDVCYDISPDASHIRSCCHW